MSDIMWDERTLEAASEVLAKWNGEVLGFDPVQVADEIRKRSEAAFKQHADLWSTGTAGYNVVFHHWNNGRITAYTYLDPGVMRLILADHSPEKTS